MTPGPRTSPPQTLKCPSLLRGESDCLLQLDRAKNIRRRGAWDVRTRLRTRQLSAAHSPSPCASAAAHGPTRARSIREAAGREKEMRCSSDSTLAYLLEAAGTRGVVTNWGNNFINLRF